LEQEQSLDQDLGPLPLVRVLTSLCMLPTSLRMLPPSVNMLIRQNKSTIAVFPDPISPLVGYRVWLTRLWQPNEISKPVLRLSPQIWR